MILLNGIPIDPGCYVDSHHGQYAPDVLADLCDALGATFPREWDPRRLRRAAERYGGVWWELHTESSDHLLEALNLATTGGLWDWSEGEIVLIPDVCNECGRNWRTDDETEPCDYCADADP